MGRHPGQSSQRGEAFVRVLTPEPCDNTADHLGRRREAQHRTQPVGPALGHRPRELREIRRKRVGQHLDDLSEALSSSPEGLVVLVHGIHEGGDQHRQQPLPPTYEEGGERGQVGREATTVQEAFGHSQLHGQSGSPLARIVPYRRCDGRPLRGGQRPPRRVLMGRAVVSGPPFQDGPHLDHREVSGRLDQGVRHQGLRPETAEDQLRDLLRSRFVQRERGARREGLGAQAAVDLMDGEEQQRSEVVGRQ
ncbi:hypothetical protein [Streptomyces scabiei]|uniref:hypothetical protein n=1 Tax=Streptomyces scabiei TaxID=1930 RepID=UPI00131C7F66|nr:hypothetical protein [Streptomyces scabiei]